MKMEYSSAMEGPTIDPKPYQWGGIILLILGILGIIFPYFASALIVFIIAFLLLIGGIMFLVVAFKGGGGFWGNLIIGIVFLAIGILMFIYPIPSLSVMTLIMGIFFAIVGIASFVLSFMVHPVPGWWAPIVSGVLSLILAALVFMGWPENSEWIIGLFVGIDLLLEGIALMAVGYMAE